VKPLLWGLASLAFWAAVLAVMVYLAP